MDELQSGPLMVKSLTRRFFVKSKHLSGLVALSVIWLWNNVMKINEYESENILYG
jgi:hypothetical protein